MTRAEQIQRLVHFGWQDGSGQEAFLRHPEYHSCGLVLLTINGVWHARCRGVLGHGTGTPDAALHLLRTRMMDLRREGAMLVRVVTAAARDAEDVLNKRKWD